MWDEEVADKRLWFFNEGKRAFQDGQLSPSLTTFSFGEVSSKALPKSPQSGEKIRQMPY
ncbi:hypothetical protein Q2T83_16365 [Fervidibacter sacchari]|uniref:hypothetical protein n=1 Tax=Candidatus Fervidibacter sacchari TaxID=1448929 RepID=UPI002168B080|nr:hypothetical protein [Candidatus Fervidibacter sacchari]WKU15892.1 hypothetical protein Q2T83_16365 [Candidatus Fervidibacter sacchari]